ncbi:uncharacterized protein GLRG_00744 [Colletotrichum graminicola M1.001]|uniref:Uncharacterized protein n=1 Tax=Colletotrichum graminicola (strain M1.001 / M2 / FGSC 10212) TaxID=645133 RepID=E3Q3J8_COLGM|nr:uncharacterized protein GLRG_00744 [Colletotrichum graminicola M1.001]EFQ25600.1 hypothetical protein GLRG_00744 [Colletotrichum graminicola M1.001]
MQSSYHEPFVLYATIPPTILTACFGCRASLLISAFDVLPRTPPKYCSKPLYEGVCLLPSLSQQEMRRLCVREVAVLPSGSAGWLVAKRSLNEYLRLGLVGST